MGGVLKALSHPVVKAPAISPPYHWPGHSTAPRASPQPQSVHVCLEAPFSGSGRGLHGEVKRYKNMHMCQRHLEMSSPQVSPSLYNRAWGGGVLLLCMYVMGMCRDGGVTMPVCLCVQPP